jgi:hypothetical protein
MDNAGEFTSQAFYDYYMSIEINVEHHVAHTLTQNGLAESFIKRLQLITRPLLMKTKLHVYAWGHAIFTCCIISSDQTNLPKIFPFQLAFGQPPNISHFRIFGCTVYIPIVPPQYTKIGPQRRLEIYVGFDSPSIIRYFEPLTDDIFKISFEDCHFDENLFPSLGKEKSLLEARQEITWNDSILSHFDPRTNECELEVQRIIHLQSIANQLPDAFTDNKKIVKSHILAANTPAKIEVHVGQSINIATNESKARLKRGRPIGAKDKIPRKRKAQGNEISSPEEATKIDPSKLSVQNSPENKSTEKEHLKKESPKELPPEEEQVPKNNEISINYISTREILDRNKIVVDNIFSFKVATDITRSNDDIEPKTVEECQRRNDWPMWNEAIQAELNSLAKRKVFGPVI